MRRKDKDIGKRFETSDLQKPSRKTGPSVDQSDPDFAEVASDKDLKLGSDEWLAEELLNIARMLMEDDDE